MWLSISQELSSELVQKRDRGEVGAYTFNWGNTRPGSFVCNGQTTSISRYEIDFAKREQMNIDNQRMRSARVVWLESASDVNPQWCGEIKQTTMWPLTDYPPDSAERPVKRLRTVCQGNWIPSVEVAHKNGMWWSFPQDLCKDLFDKREREEDVTYAWDWGKTRPGWSVHDDQATSINHYRVDFDKGEQTNLYNQRMRSVRVVWLESAQDVSPQWYGQIKR